MGQDGAESTGVVSKDWLEATFEKVGEVIAESVKAGVECGSFGLQLMPNAFEVSDTASMSTDQTCAGSSFAEVFDADLQIFGVDLLLSLPESSTPEDNLPIPRITLLEYNASPDFHQSGTRLRRDLSQMFRGVVELSVKPFFGLGQDEADKTTTVGEEKYGWRLVGRGEVRGPSK